MKLHLITVGKPGLEYARLAWAEYRPRLERYHQLRVTPVADRHNDAAHLLEAIGNSYAVALAVEGKELSTIDLARFLDQKAVEAREVSFIIGGPDGLPPAVIGRAQLSWSLGRLTLPHDLAAIVTLEALYRASSVNAGHPYHRA